VRFVFNGWDETTHKAIWKIYTVAGEKGFGFCAYFGGYCWALAVFAQAFWWKSGRERPTTHPLHATSREFSLFRS
jgi:hypothetical protein